MSRLTRIALLFSLAGVLAAWVVTQRVFEAVPHLEDEIAYVWQANVLAENKITVPSPPYGESFLVPFVVDYEGRRFGKYPFGWPLVLSLGVRLGIRSLVNPLLAGLSVWLTFLLGKRTLGEAVGVLAAGLTVTSPFFLMNSGSLLSHPLGLVLSAGFALAWLDSFGAAHGPRRWPATLAAAACLGLLAVTRPFTAVAVIPPFALHAVYLLGWGGANSTERWKTRLHLLAFGLAALAVGSLYFLWQYLLTGDPFFNPYLLWWDYDKVGFGPGHGHIPQGHTLRQGWINTKFSLRSGWRDLFGWGTYSWIFLPFGALAARSNVKALLTGSVFPSLVVVHLAYWVGSWLFGPRYFYEGLYSLTLFTAAGIIWLAGYPSHGFALPFRLPGPLAKVWSRLRRRASPVQRDPGSSVPEGVNPRRCRWQVIRFALVAALLAGLVGYNLGISIPKRMGEMYNLYTISRSDLAPFLTPAAQALTPALIIVHPQRWMPFGALLELQNPDLTSPFIFAYSRGEKIDEAVAAEFPDRDVYHYYPDQPYTFYESPKE